MLALARKINQSIMIGSDIEITLLEIKGDQVKIGINAPKSVPKIRREIADIKDKEYFVIYSIKVSLQNK